MPFPLKKLLEIDRPHCAVQNRSLLEDIFEVFVFLVSNGLRVGLQTLPSSDLSVFTFLDSHVLELGVELVN